jgi:hypothetical protein
MPGHGPTRRRSPRRVALRHGRVRHYKCYQGKDLKTPPFARLAADTADQFGFASIDVQKLEFVCTPVDKNGEGIANASVHFACYQVKASELPPRPAVELSTQFQTSRFEVKKSKLLCLPTSTTLLP